MGSVEQNFGGNATWIALLHYQMRDLWKSPRWTVLRIEALALVAIVLSFFLALFGSCRRWSNLWIVQKGFMAAQVLSLSLGTYSIGVMQSSSVKSEMYPIWAVSLLTLFGCVDPVTTYIGLDYKSPLSKMIFQLSLYFGYVMLMGVSTVSSGVGKLAIILLSTITFIKGFHRSLAFVLPGETRRNIATRWLSATEPDALAGHGERLKVHLILYLFGFLDEISHSDIATMAEIQKLGLPEGTAANGMTIKDVCLSYSFSHLLRRRFLGLDISQEMEQKINAFECLVGDGGRRCVINYEQALKVIEVELGFVYEMFYTSNEFLHFYQAKTGSFWALASFVGICFVGVVAANTIPSHHSSTIITTSAAAATGGPGVAAVNIVVETTAMDRIITLVIIGSLALLQLVQLLRCWTSNWARVGIPCENLMKRKMSDRRRERKMLDREGIAWRERLARKMSDDQGDRETAGEDGPNPQFLGWMMRLRLFLVARVNWFDEYLWQDKLGQYSLVATAAALRKQDRCVCILNYACCGRCPWTCQRLLDRVGARYVCRVLGDVLLNDSNAGGGGARLSDDVKASIAEFLGKIKSRRIGVEWAALFVENEPQEYWLKYLPYDCIGSTAAVPDVEAFTSRVMIWHIATCYCEESEQAQGGQEDEDSSREKNKNRRVAVALSNYCAYLVVSAPELLPGPATETEQVLDRAKRDAWDALLPEVVGKEANTSSILEAMQRVSLASVDEDDQRVEFVTGVHLGKRLRNERTPPQTEPCSSNTTDHWKLLAILWVQTLLYAAPYGDVQAHLQHLSQGGEFITHLWALLYHIGIHKWEMEEAGQGDTSSEEEIHTIDE